MKNIYFNFILVLLLSGSATALAQVGIGTISPNASAALDISSANSGILVPRVALTSISDITTIPSPALSLLIYNAGFAPNGYYYFNGASWIQLTVGNNDWALTGNLGTTAGTNFIGTTDTQDIRFKTNSTDRWNISHANNGQLQSFAPGTNALPAYSFQTDQDTGIFESASDILGFATAGTERVRIDAAGNMGIGTLPTASSILDMSSITNKAIEVPNVALTATTTATIAAPATGALIYNTATSGSGLTAVYPGYYYWNGTAWISLSVGGQSATTYYSSGAVSVAGNTGLTYATGYPTPAITIPANCDVLVTADIGIQTSSNTTGGFSVTDVLLIVDGAGTANGGYQRIYTTNNTGIGFNTKYASMSQTFSLAAGSHTFGIAAAGAGAGIGSSATFGGDGTSVLQGELTITIIKR